MTTKKSVDKEKEGHMLLQYKATGDLKILGILFEPYMPLIYGVCLKYLKDEAQSEDAVMQIFEQLISKLRVHTVSNFKSWLYTFARNHCLMEIRTNNRLGTLPLEENSFMENDAFMHQPFGEDVLEEQLSLMEQCMEHLHTEQQICVRLFYLEQKCYKDIAAITGYDINKVKSYIQNGKRNLKICMENNKNE